MCFDIILSLYNFSHLITNNCIMLLALVVYKISSWAYYYKLKDNVAVIVILVYLNESSWMLVKWNCVDLFFFVLTKY